MRAAHSRIRYIKTRRGRRNIQNKSSTHSPTARAEEGKKGERRRAGWTVTTSKSLRSFVNVCFFGVIVSFWLPLHLFCCFLLFVKSDAKQTPESNLKTQMFDRKSNKCGHSVPTFPELRVYLVLNSRKKNKAALVNGSRSLRINK